MRFLAAAGLAWHPHAGAPGQSEDAPALVTGSVDTSAKVWSASGMHLTSPCTASHKLSEHCSNEISTWPCDFCYSHMGQESIHLHRLETDGLRKRA